MVTMRVHTSMYEHASATMCGDMLSKAGYTLFSFSLGLLTFRFGKIKEREESVLISLKPRFSAERIGYGM